jgi:hypothetical protein
LNDSVTEGMSKLVWRGVAAAVVLPPVAPLAWPAFCTGFCQVPRTWMVPPITVLRVTEGTLRSKLRAVSYL